MSIDLKYLIYLLLGVAAIFILVWIFRRGEKEDFFEAKTISVKWAEIEDLIKKDSETARKLAIIEADKLVDYALKERRMRGKDMGERLRYAVSRYPKIHKIWEAHLLRNSLVHETHYDLSRSEAERAIKLFREGLKILGAI